MLPIIDLSESTKSLLTIRPGQTLFDAVLKMHNHRVHHLIVAEQHSFYGILPSRHILQYLQEKQIEHEDLSLIEVSSLPLISHAYIKEEHHLEEAINEMAQLNLSCIPVVDRYGRVTGILTETDIISYLANCYSSAASKRQSAAQRKQQDAVSSLPQGSAPVPPGVPSPLASTHADENERRSHSGEANSGDRAGVHGDDDLDLTDRSKVYLSNPVIQSVMKTISELGL